MIIRKETYALGNIYKSVKENVSKSLAEYLGEVFFFEDSLQTLTFKTETLVPACDPAKPNVLLLFSNPHPGSVKTGMFHCSNGNNPGKFWRFMRDAGWFDILDIDIIPVTLKKLFLSGKHGGPFNLFFDCYYDFPTRYPHHLSEIFGKDFFNNNILLTAKKKLDETLRSYAIDTIVSFNGQVTSKITGDDTRGYTKILNKGELLRYFLIEDDKSRSATIYQTYPTGYRYPKKIDKKRNKNLSLINKNIIREKKLNTPVPIEKADIIEPSIIFRIKSYYHPDLSPIELYDISRGYWRIGEKKDKAKLAFTVVNNQVLEVYEIVKWFPAGTTFSTHPNEPDPKKREFVGNIAPSEIRDKYINKSVAHYFRPGARGPFRYINL